MIVEETSRVLWKQLTQTLHNVRNDFRSIRWKRFALWSLFAIWTLALFILLVIMNVITSIPYYHEYGRSMPFALGCQPDGQFSSQANRYSYWGASGFFQITMGVTGLTFTEAKVIDIFWDIVSLHVFLTDRGLAVDLFSQLVSRSHRTNHYCIILLARFYHIRYSYDGDQPGHIQHVPEPIYLEGAIASCDFSFVT